MEFTYSTDGFLPYDSFDYIYGQRKMPEFGKVKSPYLKTLTTWRFYLARGRSEIPFGAEKVSFDDSDWDLIDVPSTWQTEGYGLPQNLLYDYSKLITDERDKKEETISDKYFLKSTNEEEDEFGIYRTEVVFTPEDIDRALYIEASGICGGFRVYINDKLACDSHSVLTRKHLLISDFVHEGKNTIAIIVCRYDRDDSGHIIRQLMNFGFSGIFRPIGIVAESLLELSNLHLQLEYVPQAYVTEVAKLDQVATITNKVPHGDYMIKVDFALRNHTNYTLPYSVRISVLEARAEYDPYKLPFVNIKGQSEPVVGVVDAGMETRGRTDFIALNVASWTDATPVQYDIVLEVSDSTGNVICAKKKRFGFRTTTVVGDKLNINDRTVNLMLTKYCEFDPQGGIAMPQSRMRQDIILMKRLGTNGVITQGWPISDDFLNLCDQYGLYVIVTAADFYMRDCVESLMNHPSLVMWGVQSFGFNPNTALKVKHECTLIDDTRPWYCPADKKREVTDIRQIAGQAGIVFGPWTDLCLDRKSIFDKNKTGTNLFETIAGRTRFTDDDADYKWIHHADLVGGKNKENSSIGQGIVDANRNPHPIYPDIKQQATALEIFPSPDNPTSLTLRNTHPFAYTEEMELEWKILLGGKILISGRGLIGEIEPYGTRNLKFPINADMFTQPGWAAGKPEYIELYVNAISHELVFDISLKLAHDTYYAKEGYEKVFYQDVLTENVASPAKDTNTKEPKPQIEQPKQKQIETKTKKANTIQAIEAKTEKSTITDADTGLDVIVEDNEVVRTEEFTSKLEAIPEGDIVGQEETKEQQLETIEEQDTAVGNVRETQIGDITAKPEVYAKPDGISLGNDNIRIGFARQTGTIDTLSIGGFNFLMGSFMPSFYRCPSNIDRTDKSFILAKTIFSGESDYENIQQTLKYKASNYGVKDGVFSQITTYKSFAMKGDILIYTEVPRADTVRVTLDFTPRYDMVRYGFRVPIVKDDVLCSWYGRGPGESYVDRKSAARLGIFSAGADKIYHPYARPAENSSHTDTQVVRITNQNGDAIVIKRVGDNPRFDFTVLPYTPEQMNEYLHEEQLMRNDSGELFLDFCTKEIERTAENITSQPLKKNVHYKETFEIKLQERT